MNFLYTINNNFVPQLGAGIASICENNSKEGQISFYIMSFGISSENKNKLTRLTKKYNRSITFIEISDIKKYFDFEIDTSGWNPIVLARLIMGRILPENVKRILYLDGDTIVISSLEELWHMDLKGKTLGMSIEPTVDHKRKEALGLKDYFYHNAGVLLVDLDKWRKNESDKKIIQYYREHNGNLFANDQDAINGALKNEILSVMPKYNFCNIFYQYPYKFLSNLVSPLKYFSKEEFENCVHNAVIIHYLGEERPWRAGNTHKYKKYYEKYLGMTDWKDTPYEEGWRVYFVCWRLFNLIMKPVPKVRYYIINMLIPCFMKYRAKKLRKGN